MTSKQIYEATAIELSKVQAPALKLYEFNYFFNQAIRQFVNKVYNVYDVNQQTTDDLRVLKATATLKPEVAESTGNKALDYLRGATYYVDMPDDYLHLLNCICLFDVNKRKECWDKGDVMIVGATKLTADSWSSVVDDVYNQPTKKRPYYYVHNQNDIHVERETGEFEDYASELPSNSETDKIHEYSNAAWLEVLNNAREESLKTGENAATASSVWNIAKSSAFSDAIPEMPSDVKTPKQAYNALSQIEITYEGSNFARTFDYHDFNSIGSEGYKPTEYSSVEKPGGSRHANSSRVKVEIRCGRDKSNIFSLSAVQIDYVKALQILLGVDFDST